MDFSNRVIFVTGGAGFIGSHIVDQLVTFNAEKVIAFDDFSAGYKSFINPDYDNVVIVEGDITDRSSLEENLATVDIVIHTAAQADVARSIEEPLYDFKNNAEGSLNVLDASLKNDVKRVVVVGSAAVYGNETILENDRRFKETQAVHPISPYGANKLYTEQIARVYHKCYGLQTVTLRYFSIYGPRQIPKPGSHSWAVAIFIANALAKKDLIIFGDGKQIRDQTFVKDAAYATVLAADEPNAVGKIINVGSGKPTTIFELVRLVKVLIDPTLKIRFAPRPIGDPLGGYADTTLLKKVLNYVPDTPLPQGVREHSEWYKRYGFERKQRN